MRDNDNPANAASPPHEQAEDQGPGFDDLDADAPSLIGDVRELVDDALAAADAELEFQKARAVYTIRSLIGVVALGGLAAAFALLSLLALTVGLVLALTPLLTALGATVAVIVGYLTIGAALALVARSRWRRMVGEIASGKDAA